MCHGSMRPFRTRSPSTSEESAKPTWVMKSIRRRSVRSAIAPPKRPKITIDAARIPPPRPRRIGSPVIWYRSHDVVVVSIQSPTCETVSPLKYSAKSRCRSGRRPGKCVLRDKILAVFTPIRQSRASGEIVSQIERAIFAAELSAGDRLQSERELAEQFGVSRITVRDALRVLEARGLIRVKVGAMGGAFVADAN